MIDLGSPTSDLGELPALAVQRMWANTVQLPDGSMVTIGGDDMVRHLDIERAVELYDPVTGSMAHRAEPGRDAGLPLHRLLLPDGRVLSTATTATRRRPDDTGEVHSPYLFGAAAKDLVRAQCRPLGRPVRGRRRG